jgi:hypothetical protein
MTTEIAIMNKSAVALAADSAVTIQIAGPRGNSYKVLNSANKLFALSKYSPVGVMIYGNANMLGIPWETIVKIYRVQLGGREFPDLDGYCQDFFEFLDRFNVGDEVEERYVTGGATSIFRGLKDELDTWVGGQIEERQAVTPDQVKTKLTELVKIRYDEFVKIGKGSVLSKTKRSNLRTKYRSQVKSIAREIFEKLPFTQRMESQLLTIAISAASVGPRNQSGIVIAGFGTKDLYPHCRSYDVAAVFAGKTIKRDGQKESVTHDMEAAIIPFAQADDVRTFMEGISPVLIAFLKKTFYGIMTNGLPDRLRDEVSTKLGLTESQKKELREITGDVCKGACDFAFNKFTEQQRIYHIDPVVRATTFLNKAELAAMAETLVNLVSFRKQVTIEADTVGGPIDVAVITKGDGLVWIKRKHYFRSELNHHFFSNYYRKGGIND